MAATGRADLVVAAIKECQAPKLGPAMKTLSVTGYGIDKAGARPNQSVSVIANKSAPAEDGTGTSAATLRPTAAKPAAQKSAQTLFHLPSLFRPHHPIAISLKKGPESKHPLSIPYPDSV